MFNVRPDAFWPWFRVKPPEDDPLGFRVAGGDRPSSLFDGQGLDTGPATPFVGGSLLPYATPPIFPQIAAAPLWPGLQGYGGEPDVRHDTPGFHVKPPTDDPRGFRAGADGSARDDLPDDFGLTSLGYDPHAAVAPPYGIGSGDATRPAEYGVYPATDLATEPAYLTTPPRRDAVQEALDQIARIYAGVAGNPLSLFDRQGSDVDSVAPVGDEARLPYAARPVLPQTADSVTTPVVPAQYTAGGGGLSPPSYGLPMTEGSLGSLAGDLARLAARAAPMVAGGVAALPLLVIPMNTQSDTVDLGDGLRARRRPGQRSVEIERRAEDGLFGTGIGARWETVPVDAEMGAGPDGGPAVFIDHRQLVDAVGPEAAARAQAMIGGAMARPPRKSDESPPPAGIGHNSGEAPDPENGDKPPPVTPPLFPSSKQGSEEIPEADRAYARLAVKYKLQPTSPTTRQLLENLDMPLETFVGQYRVGRILKEFPGELQRGTVRDVLESGNTKARKFLTDGRFHR